MAALFEQNIVSERRIIDFHTHPYRKRGEFMGMYGGALLLVWPSRLERLFTLRYNG